MADEIKSEVDALDPAKEAEKIELRRKISQLEQQLEAATGGTGAQLAQAKVQSHELLSAGSSVWEFVVETPTNLVKLYMRRIRVDAAADPATDDVVMRPTAEGIGADIRVGRVWYRGVGMVLCERKKALDAEPTLDEVAER